MRQHLSVFMLQARATAHWFLLLIVLMVGAEVLLMQKSLRLLEEGYIPFETLVGEGFFAVVFVVALALQALLSMAISDEKGHTTLRLSVSEEALMLWHTLYHFMCYLILWGVQLLLLLLLLDLYQGRVDPSYLNHQSAMLSFYRGNFLHTILPLGHTSLYIRNIAMFAFLSLGAAFILQDRRTSQGLVEPSNVFSGLVLAVQILFLMTFVSRMSDFSMHVFLTVLMVFLVALIVVIQHARRKSFVLEREGME